MVFHSLIILTMISENEHKVMYRFNYQIQQYIKQFTCAYTCVFICYMSKCMDPGNFARRWGPVAIFSRGFNPFFGGGGVQSPFSIETCGLSRVGGSGPPSPSGSAHDLYTCVSV